MNNANGCISVHALMDQGQDVYVCVCVYLCAHMYMNVCEGQSSQPDSSHVEKMFSAFWTCCKKKEKKKKEHILKI